MRQIEVTMAKSIEQVRHNEQHVEQLMLELRIEQIKNIVGSPMNL
jgi:hypothetical protein